MSNLAVITRDELNHERALYESQIDQLNEVLDEIRDALPNGDNLSWYAECADACSKIGQIIDKRPVQP
jgi:hypothetical protein